MPEGGFMEVEVTFSPDSEGLKESVLKIESKEQGSVVYLILNLTLELKGRVIRPCLFFEVSLTKFKYPIFMGLFRLS